MLKTLGVVYACCESADYRRKISRRLGGKSVLEWVVRRSTDCQRLDGVIVVTGENPENAFIADMVPPDVPVFKGRSPDALALFAAAIEEYPAHAAVHIRADNPFLDPVLLDQLVSTADTRDVCDYVSYCLRDGRPAVLSPLGIFAEWIRAKALRRAARKAKTAEDRCEVGRYLYSHPELFNLRLIPAPARIERDEVEAMAHIDDHWECAQTMYEALGPEALDWQRIAVVLDRHLAMRKQAVLDGHDSGH